MAYLIIRDSELREHLMNSLFKKGCVTNEDGANRRIRVIMLITSGRE